MSLPGARKASAKFAKRPGGARSADECRTIADSSPEISNFEIANFLAFCGRSGYDCVTYLTSVPLPSSFPPWHSPPPNLRLHAQNCNVSGKPCILIGQYDNRRNAHHSNELTLAAGQRRQLHELPDLLCRSVCCPHGGQRWTVPVRPASLRAKPGKAKSRKSGVGSQQ
jgi:hypothetical protein